MRFVAIIYCFTFIIGCVQKKDRSEDATIVSNASDSTPASITRTNVIIKNDTLCSAPSPGHVRGVKFIQTCTIFFDSQSSRRYIWLAIGGDIPAEFNYETSDDQDLVYRKSGDTISIKVSYINADRGTKLILDSVYEWSGVIYLIEKEVELTKSVHLHQDLFETFEYTVLSKRADLTFRRRLVKHNRLK
jgi:hypothetical protein